MWRQWFRRGKGRNEGKRSEVLAAIGVPTIHPIALGEQRKRNFLFENYLITWEIPGTIPWTSFLKSVSTTTRSRSVPRSASGWRRAWRS